MEEPEALPTPKPRRPKAFLIWAGRLLLVVVGFFLAFVMAEWLTRISLPVFSPNIYKIDSRTGLVTYIPNAHGFYRKSCFKTEVSINSLGWRTGEFTAQKSEGVYRIIVLGDSFVAGLETPLEKTFHKRLEKLLNDYFGDMVFEVISLGRGNNGLYYDYRYLKDFGVAYNPDLVIIVSFVNDPADDLRDMYGPREGRLFTMDDDGNIVDDYVSEREGIMLHIRSTLRRSAFIKLLYDRSSDFVTYLREGKLPLTGEEALQGINENLDFAYALEKELVFKMKNLAEEKGAKLLIFNAPYRKQVEAYVNTGEDYYYVGSYSHEKMMEDIARETDVSFVNLIPLFGQNFRTTRESFDYTCDSHWNETGHAWISEGIFSYLVGKFEL